MAPQHRALHAIQQAHQVCDAATLLALVGAAIIPLVNYIAPTWPLLSHAHSNFIRWEAWCGCSASSWVACQHQSQSGWGRAPGETCRRPAAAGCGTS